MTIEGKGDRDKQMLEALLWARAFGKCHNCIALRMVDHGRPAAIVGFKNLGDFKSIGAVVSFPVK